METQTGNAQGEITTKCITIIKNKCIITQTGDTNKKFIKRAHLELHKIVKGID